MATTLLVLGVTLISLNVDGFWGKTAAFGGLALLVLGNIEIAALSMRSYLRRNLPNSREG